MITKEDIARAGNLPKELKSMLDLPWHYLGEVNAKVLRAIMPTMVCLMHDDKISPEVVLLKRHELVTDDLIRCIICCGSNV